MASLFEKHLLVEKQLHHLPPGICNIFMGHKSCLSISRLVNLDEAYLSDLQFWQKRTTKQFLLESSVINEDKTRTKLLLPGKINDLMQGSKKNNNKKNWCM